MRPTRERIEHEAAFLYGTARAREVSSAVWELASRWRSRIRPPARPPGSPAERIGLDESDAILIAYGDQLSGPGPGLPILEGFLDGWLGRLASGLHILPFFPYSSDDGFAVIDFRAVDPRLGTWSDIERIGSARRLMVDLVLNHVSASSAWFQGFLRGQPPYQGYFITVAPGTDLSAVFRPRALPLLTPFATADGPRLLWTTFSADQIDLDYANPAVLLEMLDVLLGYAARGAQMVRLDAVAYAWKEIGTRCLHHPKVHGLVRLIRSVLDEAAPWVLIVTETNVPQAENIAYFGDGWDEAQMVYQFPLPPLVFDAFLQADASYLRSWARGLGAPAKHTTFFNFLASHDGIGVLPAEGILPSERIEGLVRATSERGGYVSYRTGPGGERPYELNISYMDAVAPADSDDRTRAQAFLASQAILLALAGVPGIYFHSLVGTRGDQEAVRRTGAKRAVNRRRLALADLEDELRHEDSPAGAVFAGYHRLLEARRSHPAFHPSAGQEVLDTEGPVFALLRTARDGRRVLCVTNVAGLRASWRLPKALSLPPGRLHRALAGHRAELELRSGQELALEAYETLWLDLGRRQDAGCG